MVPVGEDAVISLVFGVVPAAARKAQSCSSEVWLKTRSSTRLMPSWRSSRARGQLFHRAQGGVHLAVAADGIAAVVLAGRRLEERHQVQVGQAQLFEIGDAAAHALQVCRRTGPRTARRPAFFWSWNQPARLRARRPGLSGAAAGEPGCFPIWRVEKYGVHGNPWFSRSATRRLSADELLHLGLRWAAAGIAPRWVVVSAPTALA
jgi:hypothetical protein